MKEMAVTVLYPLISSSYLFSPSIPFLTFLSVSSFYSAVFPSHPFSCFPHLADLISAYQSSYRLNWTNVSDGEREGVWGVSKGENLRTWIATSLLKRLLYNEI